ncbi:hypothetical protein PVK06_020715 [Gossypium arboreum]|uniref:Myb/SANT-like domain-containing protein n=1 Tax=Gossypium arboreum TaxID=29729 RepID=A0ABR0PN38_GOSAR|nr:hypothetical protein PVK06_020715 [Gossypium arboreum]
MELMFVHPFHLAFKEDFVAVKGGMTQNVLVAITFYLKFSYVLVGWEGSAHDSHILSDAISRTRGLRIPEVQCDAKHVENHLRTVKNQWQIICTIRSESGLGWDDNMKMITCDRAAYDAAVMAHKKYEPFLNKSIDHYDDMALVVCKDMATRRFARTFADIDLDYGNQDSVPINCDNEETEEVRTNVSSSSTFKRKRKNAQESVVNEQIKFLGEQLGKIVNTLEQFTVDKTPYLYEEVMPMEVEGFDDDFLCSVFDYLVSHESEAKAFLVKNMGWKTHIGRRSHELYHFEENKKKKAEGTMKKMKRMRRRIICWMITLSLMLMILRWRSLSVLDIDLHHRIDVRLETLKVR